jgi:ATP-dependent DNA helicase RecG
VATEQSPANAARHWLIRLQRSLAVETDHGFTDLHGQQQRFSCFLAEACRQPPEPLHRLDDPAQLPRFAERFKGYDHLDEPSRRRLVVELRRHLLTLQRALDPAAPPAPPKLRLAQRPAVVPPAGPNVGLEASTPLSQVRGIGPRTASRLAAMGLFTVEDLLRHYPRDYVDYSRLTRIAELQTGSTATVVAQIRRCSAFVSPRQPNLAILDLQLQDITGRLRLSRFLAGRRFTSPGALAQQQRLYPLGATVAASGLVREGRYGLTLQDALIEVLESATAPLQSREIGRVLPVYPLTEGLTAQRLRQAVQAVRPALARWPDPLPDVWRQLHGLPELAQALDWIHDPPDQHQLQRSRQRLVFDEFLLLQLALGQRRQQMCRRPAPSPVPLQRSPRFEAFLAALPFPLTEAQRRVLEEIRADLGRSNPMARLVQGDVGCGKTVVAVAALLLCIDAGQQGAFMAPTEVLARQHLTRLVEWLTPLQVTVELLTGSTPTSRRRERLQQLAEGQLQLLVGTHALLEDPVGFDDLGLVVVDEQHRFGVRQRDRLMGKGRQPHLLTMTATPIPRTLALGLHGDLDVSIIDQLPPGRTPVQTEWLRPSQRSQAWEIIGEELDAGRQAYVVLPLVEDSETLDLRSAMAVHRQLSEEVFPDRQVGLLHGRQPSPEKTAVIEAFVAGRLQVLVSTTVVEVGVDVPNASVMLVEHADRFGLAQLHQLRGRVGRGAARSRCLLLSGSDGIQARQRLQLLCRSNDGFEIAEMDLRLRGPGEVLGTRQSGLPDLALASLVDDGAVLELARDTARSMLDQDPQLVGWPRLAAMLDQQRRRALGAAQLN